MKIAIDYDRTYDQDPVLWDGFILDAMLRGHDVRIITARNHELDNIDDKIRPEIRVIYCDGVAKKWFCQHRADFWEPDVWIDDKPEGILTNGPLTEEQIAEWRANR